MSVYTPKRLTVDQLRTLVNLACGNEVAIDPTANAGERGPVIAFVGDLRYEIDERGRVERG